MREPRAYVITHTHAPRNWSCAALIARLLPCRVIGSSPPAEGATLSTFNVRTIGGVGPASVVCDSEEGVTRSGHLIRIDLRLEGQG